MNSGSHSLRQKLSAWAAFIARLAFGLTIVLIPFRFRYILLERPVPDIYKDYTDFLLFGSDIAVSFVLIFWMFSLLFGRSPVWLGPKFMLVPLVGLLFTSLITSFTSLDISLSLYNTIRSIILFLLYLYIINEVRSLSLIGISISIQVIIQSLVALAQFFLQYAIGLAIFGEHELDPAIGGVSIVSIGSTRILRSYGLTEHPNVLGGSLAFSLILLFAIYLYGKQRMKRGVVPVFLFGLLALFVTFSRSAWLAFLVGTISLTGVIAILHDWQKIKSVFWLSLLGTLLLIPLAWQYSDYIGARLNVGDSFENNADEHRSIEQRLTLNKAGIQIFLDRPLAGIGLGASALAIKKYFAALFVPPHFVLLVVAMEIGIFGLICYLLLFFIPFLLVIRNTKSLFDNPCLLTASTLLIALFLIGLFDIYPWLLPSGRLWQWLIWGFWAVAHKLADWFSEN